MYLTLFFINWLNTFVLLFNAIIYNGVSNITEIDILIIDKRNVTKSYSVIASNSRVPKNKARSTNEK